MRTQGALTRAWMSASRFASPAPVNTLSRIGENLCCDNEWLISGNSERQIPEYHFTVAATRETRERAYRLAYEIYRSSNLVPADPTGMVVCPSDAGLDTFTVLAEDENGEAIGTVSLVFDSERGLPSDEIYGEEMDALRRQGRRAAEVTRLALKKNVPSSRELLVRMFNLIYIYATRVRGYTDFVIEVNPRHLPYYEKTLKFSAYGGLKSCPRVEGAPAVLARLDLSVPMDEVKRVGGMKLDGRSCRERTLYPWFWTYGEESAIASHLDWQYEAMEEDEAAYFGLSEQAAASA